MSTTAHDDLLEQLLARERQFWDASSGADGDFYRRNVIEEAVYVFPGTAGAIDREACAAIVEQNDEPWSAYRFEGVRLVELATDAVLLSYRSLSEREARPPLSMLVSTAYVRRGGRWLLAFHQQTIIPR